MRVVREKPGPLAGVLILLLATASACAEKKQPAPVPLYVGGRVVVDTDGSMRFGWPGVYFEGRFKGNGLTVRLRNGADRLRLLIDGVEKASFTRTGQVDARIDGLGDGEHSVRLEKLGETQNDESRLFGIFAAGEGVPLSPPGRTGRQIEFIGDSYTVGYGNASPGRICTTAQVRDTTDTQRAFGPIVARRLGADYRVNAYSGFGMVRNYGGSRPGESMPGLYQRLIPKDPAPVEIDPRGWHPQFIVVNLGTNDFSTPLQAGEPWASQAALHTAYRARYLGFARDLMAREPNARLILMGADAFIADVRQVADELGSKAPGRVSTIHFERLDLEGCDWHPSLKDHKHLADLLQAEIGRIAATPAYQGPFRAFGP
ncbi:GDSL-type esterase/lipase family protein [Sphingomonas sp. QA11]|uniref:SGNH/GDSL hydrolase family protein n=1 Tax=Sphingomonas sp. QA11 TaxID=2950605 RepID=UPI00234BD937|nr:SGNH/GDSL hydrolase family protein [Sphingomonas sp. QA11]WCM28978.1 GDSL-type esterase/lipase family protein [Sphingomonas sp. QA11]